MTRVIIADDSDTARMFVRRCFEVAGLADATILEAANGQEVLDYLDESEVQLVITDLNMPVVDGRTLLRTLRKRPEDIPVIVVSSATNAALVLELSELGAVAVVKKPPTPALAVEALKRVPGVGHD